MYKREDDGVARKQPSQGQTDWPFPDGTEAGDDIPRGRFGE